MKRLRSKFSIKGLTSKHYRETEFKIQYKETDLYIQFKEIELLIQYEETDLKIKKKRLT